MALPTPKEIKRLADACRKSGIKTFRSGDVEFTLTDEAPMSAYKAKKAATTDVQGEIETDELTNEQLLSWSLMDLPGTGEETIT